MAAGVGGHAEVGVGGMPRRMDDDRGRQETNVPCSGVIRGGETLLTVEIYGVADPIMIDEFFELRVDLTGSARVDGDADDGERY